MPSEWTFRVRLSKVSLKSLAATVERPAGSAPYYRCDFDGKLMQSEVCNAAGDPVWGHKATFDYRLDEDSLQDVVASLAARWCTFDVCFTDGTRHTTVGTASIDLYSLATGASQLQLSLLPPDAATAHNATSSGAAAVGVLHAAIEMEHLNVIETTLESASVNNLPDAMQVQATVAVLEDTGTKPVESRITAPSRDPMFDRCPPVLTRTSLRVYVNNTLRVRFYDVAGGGSALMGAVDVPIKEMLVSACDQSAVFKRNLYADPTYRRSFTAHVTATVAMRNLPSFSQLSTGLNNAGNIHGKPLLEGAMLPPRYSKFPSRLPDYVPAPQPVVTPLSPQRHPRPDPINDLPPSGMPHTEAQLHDGRGPGEQHGFASAGRASRLGDRSPGMHAIAENPAPVPPRTFSPVRPRSPHQPAQHELQRTAAPTPQPLSYHHDAHQSHAHQSNISSGAPAGLNRSAAPAGSAVAAARRGIDLSRSPIAGVAQSLKAQHDEALAAIEEQRRRVAHLTEDLQRRTHTEQDSERRKHDALEAEDRTLHSRFEASTRNIEELRRIMDEADATASNDANTIRAEQAECEQELEDLEATERDLHAFLSSLQRHAEDSERKREMARQQAAEARELLENDAHALADFEARVAQRQRTRAASPYRQQPMPMNASVVMSRASSPPRPVSPPSHSGASRYHDASMGAGPSSPPKPAHAAAAEGELLDAIVTGNESAYARVVAHSPEVLHQSHVWLLRACGAPSPNDAIVAGLLQRRPELVHMVDPTTANTPLHHACNAQRPNSGVVSMLLSSGANPYAFNVNGLTPMHLALLNVNDYDHAVKRALIAKAGVGVLDQPSSSGETGAHMAAANDRHLASLRFLKDNGANMTPVAMLLRDGRHVAVTPRERALWAGRDAEGCRRLLEGAR